MAQIRIQAFCAGCQSNIDLITHASRAGEVLSTLSATLRVTHLASCYEDSHGQDEAGSGDAAEGPEGQAAARRQEAKDLAH